jgi:hypothetical protein
MHMVHRSDSATGSAKSLFQLKLTAKSKGKFAGGCRLLAVLPWHGMWSPRVARIR